ncbi:MAG: SURF1 family protein [Ilumatobacteraceae bacterium]
MATDPAELPARGSKYRFLFSPKWIAFHLLVIVVVVAMVNLAFWQLRRLDQRREFNSQVRANANQPIATFDEVADRLSQPSTIEWRRVRVTGTYVSGHQFEVVNRSQNGETGRNVVDGLQLPDGSLLLVNRGFVNDADATPAVPGGPVVVVGRLRASEHRVTGQPADNGADVLTEIRRIDIDVLSKQFDANVLPMYVEQLEATPADFKSLEPIVAPTLDEGPHLSYTVQWFIFSVCAMVGWFLAVRRSLATRSGKPPKKRRSSYVPIADDESVG